jgi:two-component system CheB/CheR fusion protein
VRKEGLLIKAGNGNGGTRSAGEVTRRVNFEVAPIRSGKHKEQYFMIIFEETPPKVAQKRGQAAFHESESQSGRIVKLEQELAATKEYLQSVIETQEAMNEELQTANEEILSSNEELQSTNEELETAKEELQSANEELRTVNDELRSRNADLSPVNNDLTNLLANVGVAAVLVGSDLVIRRFTPQAQPIFGLIPADVGRPLSNINPTVEIPDFREIVLRAISEAHAIDAKAIDKSGTSYFVRVSPYRVAEHRIDGAVIVAISSEPVLRILGKSSG